MEVGGQQVFVVVHEGFLQGAVEAFDVGVHFGAFGVGVPATDVVGMVGTKSAHPALPVRAWGERSEALPRGAWGLGGHKRAGGRLVGRASPPTRKPGF
jgi:hypothetical protein